MSGIEQDSEVYRRLNDLEGGLREHISSCTERRLREEDWHRASEQKLSQLETIMRDTNQKIENNKANIDDIKAKFAVIVAVVSGLLATLGDVAVDWFRGQ